MLMLKRSSWRTTPKAQGQNIIYPPAVPLTDSPIACKIKLLSDADRLDWTRLKQEEDHNEYFITRHRLLFTEITYGHMWTSQAVHLSLSVYGVHALRDSTPKCWEHLVTTCYTLCGNNLRKYLTSQHQGAAVKPFAGQRHVTVWLTEQATHGFGC